jgi:two-component system chemotaxis response regulator CheY
MHSASAETMKLGAVLDLGAAEQLMLDLRQRLQGDSGLRLDASGVEVMTLPCVQLILAAAKGASDVGIVNPSAAFESAFADFSLDFPRAPDLAPTQDPNASESEEADKEPVDENLAADDSPASSDPIEEAVMTKRILTIDDSKTIRDMLRMTLVDAGFEVLQAVDGQEGVEVMDRETVDLVITDINMPRMNGYEVVRNLRDRPALKGLPILVLTTESDVDKKNLAREAGATGWMVKPFDPDRLIATVRKVIP